MSKSINAIIVLHNYTFYLNFLFKIKFPCCLLQHHKLKMAKKLENISLLCQGSRGDFQPYLALAVELKKAGYNVRILTNIAYKKYAEEFHVDHVTIGEEDMEKFMNEDPDIVESMSNGDVKKMFDVCSKQTLKHAKTDCNAFIEEMENNRPDILIIGTFGDYFKYYASMLVIYCFSLSC